MAGLNHWCFQSNFGGLPIFTWKQPPKNWQRPEPSLHHQGTCYLPILKSLGARLFPCNKGAYGGSQFWMEKTRHQTPRFPPQKKKLRKNSPWKMLTGEAFPCCYMLFFSGYIRSFSGGELLHQSEPEAHFLRCTHLMRNEPVSLLYLLGHGTHTSWDVPMFMEFVQDLQHQA